MAVDTTSFFIDLFLLLGAAVVAGEVASRLGQAALVGQLLVGVLLGPSLLGPYIGLATLSPSLSAIQFLATVFVLFMAGLDVNPEQIYRMGASTVLMGIAVFAVPFAALSVLSELLVPLLLPGQSPLLPLFMGLTLSITALPVMGILLIEFGLLKTRIGNLLINTALINELVAVSVFAVLLDVATRGTSGTLAIIIAALSVAVFLGVVLSIHMLLRALRTARWWQAGARALGSWRTREAGFAILMVCVIGASLFSQFMGLTFVVGAFYAGILVTQDSAGAEAHRTISSIVGAMTWGFFVPLFFALVGVQMNLSLMATWTLVGLFAALLALAILSKLGTGYSVARFFRWPKPDALAIGHLVSCRGAVELAMAVFLLSDGIFTTRIFTIVAAVGLVTTMIAPIAAKRVWATRATVPDRLQEQVDLLTLPLGGPEQPFPVTLSFGILDERPKDLAPSDVGPARGGGPPSGPPPSGRPATPPPPEPGPPPLPDGRRPRDPSRNPP